MEILGYDGEARAFLEEWQNTGATVTAHTSGSTGRPKPVELNKTDMQVSALATCRYFDIRKGDLLFLPLQPTYIAGKMMIVRAFMADADLKVEKPSNKPLHIRPDRRIRLAAIVPSQIPGLLESGNISMIDRIIVGGAPISDKYERMLLDAGAEAYATYGMTETCSHVALRKLGEKTYRALPHIKFSTDNRGCLVIHSADMSFGKLVTNDIVTLIDSTSFEWMGRYDNVINSGGIKLFPEMIERKLSAVLPGREYYIASRSDDKWGSRVVLYIEGLKPVEELSEIIKSILDKTERPKEIVYVDRFQRTHSGKIKRILPEN